MRRSSSSKQDAANEFSTILFADLQCPSPSSPLHTTNHSAQKQERAAAAITAGVVSGVGAMMANPLVAEAAVTPSLRNFLYSLLAGGAVLGVIAAAITAVANFDPVKRG